MPKTIMVDRALLKLHCKRTDFYPFGLSHPWLCPHHQFLPFSRSCWRRAGWGDRPPATYGGAPRRDGRQRGAGRWFDAIRKRPEMEKVRGFNACAYTFRCHTIHDDFHRPYTRFLLETCWIDRRNACVRSRMCTRAYVPARSVYTRMRT
jgi:hypothetical protein